MKSLSLAIVNRFRPLAAKRGVSKVARSQSGFLAAFAKAGGKINRMPKAWQKKRQNFIKRHYAQIAKRKEPLFDTNGEPTRRHLALVMWAASPSPAKLNKSYKRGMPKWVGKHRSSNPGTKTLRGYMPHVGGPVGGSLWHKTPEASYALEEKRMGNAVYFRKRGTTLSLGHYEKRPNGFSIFPIQVNKSDGKIRPGKPVSVSSEAAARKAVIAAAVDGSNYSRNPGGFKAHWMRMVGHPEVELMIDGRPSEATRISADRKGQKLVLGTRNKFRDAMTHSAIGEVYKSWDENAGKWIYAVFVASPNGLRAAGSADNDMSAVKMLFAKAERPLSLNPGRRSAMTNPVLGLSKNMARWVERMARSGRTEMDWVIPRNSTQDPDEWQRAEKYFKFLVSRQPKTRRLSTANPVLDLRPEVSKWVEGLVRAGRSDIGWLAPRGGYKDVDEWRRAERYFKFLISRRHPSLAFAKNPASKKARPRLGSGKRFSALSKKLKKRGVGDPKALAAWIGMQKYGKEKFLSLAAKGRRRKKAAN